MRVSKFQLNQLRAAVTFITSWCDRRHKRCLQPYVTLGAIPSLLVREAGSIESEKVMAEQPE